MAMAQTKPLNFAQALRSKPAQPEPEATETESQLSTSLDSQLSTTPAIQIPPASQLSTIANETASRQAPRKRVDSHYRKRVDSRKGDRHKGDKVPFNNRISEATYNRIKHFLVDHNLEQQEFAELSAIHFMDAVESHHNEEPASQLAHDDREMMMLYKTSPFIINLYLQYNPENRWKPADDYEGVKYNNADIRAVELGIIQTQFNARFKKINSFKYYTTEIDLVLETPFESNTVDIMLHQARKRWKEATR
jgi:hypothetical protein